MLNTFEPFANDGWRNEMIATTMKRRSVVVGSTVLALCAGFFGVPSAGGAQDASDTTRVTIQGTVVDADTRRPIRGVTVRLHAFNLDLETDIEGAFVVEGLRIGAYRMTLRRFDYETVSGEFEILNGGSFTVPMKLLDREGPPAIGRFVGRVTDAESGDGLEGVGVRIPQVFMGVLTDETGRFVLEDVPAGLQLIEFDNLGYAIRRETVTIVGDQTTDARVRLTVDAIDLEPIEVVVERRELKLEDVGFYVRRDEGWGSFIDLADIEAQSPSETTDLFTRMPGVTLVNDSYDAFRRYVMLRGGRRSSFDGQPCYPAVWLDGIQVHRGGSEPAGIDDLLSLNAIAGIEVFQGNSGVPVRYGGLDTTCGVILLWTRI
jgi:hypothetical protein